MWGIFHWKKTSSWLLWPKVAMHFKSEHFWKTAPKQLYGKPRRQADCTTLCGTPTHTAVRRLDVYMEKPLRPSLPKQVLQFFLMHLEKPANLLETMVGWTYRWQPLVSPSHHLLLASHLTIHAFSHHPSMLAGFWVWFPDTQKHGYFSKESWADILTISADGTSTDYLNVWELAVVWLCLCFLTFWGCQGK